MAHSRTKKGGKKWEVHVDNLPRFKRPDGYLATQDQIANHPWKERFHYARYTHPGQKQGRKHSDPQWWWYLDMRKNGPTRT